MFIPMKHLALVGLLVAVPVSAWAIAYRPMNSAVRHVAEEIKARTTSLSYYDEVNTQYRELKRISKSLQQATSLAKARIPQQHDADLWLEYASKEAQNLGMTVKSVTTAGERPEGEYKILPVDLVVVGTFESLYNLLQHLERIDRISRVDKMSIHRIEDDFVEARVVIELVFSPGDEL
jgi:Tfp pilus assembly protein PilO